MILNEIRDKLLDLDSRVYYGMVDRSVRETMWNYIVFNRKPTKVNDNKTGYSHYYTVNVIREDFVPEGMEQTVINKMLEISGMRLAGTDFQYTYVEKPNTNAVVEMLSIDFVRAVKV